MLEGVAAGSRQSLVTMSAPRIVNVSEQNSKSLERVGHALTCLQGAKECWSEVRTLLCKGRPIPGTHEI